MNKVNMEIRVVTLFLLFVASTNGQQVIGRAQPTCSESLSDGKRKVVCKGYSAIPTDIESAFEVGILIINAGNYLQQLKPTEFADAGLVRVNKLDLSNNQINNIEHGAFDELDVLTEINLSNNNLGTLDMEIFQKNDQLRILRFQGNPIHQLSGSMFPSLPNLRTLDLSLCQIKKIPKLAFSNLGSLEELLLRGNNLTRVDWNVFEKTHKLALLDLAENPWYCDCHVKFLKEFLELKKIQTPYSKLICAEPVELNNVSWNLMEQNDLICHPNIISFQPINHEYDGQGAVYSEIGKDIAFECVIESYPAPEVTWEKDKKIVNETNARGLDDEIGNESRITIEKNQNRLQDDNGFQSRFNFEHSSLLRIYKAETNDMGKYSCMIKNKAGHDAKSIFLNLTNIPIDDVGEPVKTGGSKTWLWIVIPLIILILIASLVLCFGVWKRKEYKKQKILKKQMMEKFKDSQAILDDAEMQPRKVQHTLNRFDGNSSSAPLLPPPNNAQIQIRSLESRQLPDVAKGNPEYVRSLSPEVFSPRPPSTADMKRQFFALRQMSEPPTMSSRPGSAMSMSNYPDPQGRRFQFAQHHQHYPGSADRYYSIRRPGSSLSLVYPEQNSNHQQRPQFNRQYSGPAIPSYATLRFQKDRRPPSVSSFTSEPAQENFRPGFGYVTLPRGFAPQRADSGFGRSLSPTESTYSSFSYSTLPRRGRIDPNTGVVYDAVGPRTSVDGGSNLSLNRIGESQSNNVLDSISQGLFSPTRGKVKSARSRTGSSTTPGSIRGRNDFFSFEPIQEVEGSDDVLTKLSSNNEIDQVLPKIHTLPRNSESRFAKKKAPVITNLPARSRKPIRTFEYSKYPVKQNSNTETTEDEIQSAVEETSIDDPNEVNVDNFYNKVPQLPPNPPPKPHRLQSSIENIFDLQIQPTILEEVPGTEV